MSSDFWRRVDWRIAFGLPPRRRFSDAELARAQASTVSPTVAVSMALNVLLPLGLIVTMVLEEAAWPLALLTVAFAGGVTGAALNAWRNPSSRLTHLLYWVVPLGTAVAVVLLHRVVAYPRHLLMLVWGEVMVGTLALWFCIVWRHHHIESRLREAAERERAIEMAQRLANAQIEPHFLFNTLASLQHWVDGGDARAAPFLRSLTGYLRATLPMFGQAMQPLAAELTAVRRYLEVMQARFGSRLSWRIEVPEDMHALELPPGALLTLVENAIEHGIEPLLRGGELRVEGALVGPRVRLAVLDNGPGPAAGVADGQGLANVRERLRLAFGEAAQLSLAAREPAGCAAILNWTRS